MAEQPKPKPQALRSQPQSESVERVSLERATPEQLARAFFAAVPPPDPRKRRPPRDGKLGG